MVVSVTRLQKEIEGIVRKASETLNNNQNRYFNEKNAQVSIIMETLPFICDSGVFTLYTCSLSEPVLITFSNSEGSGESVHYAQTRQNLYCSNTQSMDVDEDSDQNLDLFSLWICRHWRLKEALRICDKCKNSQELAQIVIPWKCTTSIEIIRLICVTHTYFNIYLTLNFDPRAI